MAGLKGSLSLTKGSREQRYLGQVKTNRLYRKFNNGKLTVHNFTHQSNYIKVFDVHHHVDGLRIFDEPFVFEIT